MKIDLDKYNNKFVVYLLTSPSGKQYCGYSSDIKQRWKTASAYSGCTKIWNAIQKYGWENIKKEILYVFDNEQEALQKEIETIQEKDLINKGYNILTGGNIPPHGKQYLTPEGLKRLQLNGKRLANEIWSNPEKAAYAKQRMSEVAKKRADSMTEEERKQVYGAHNIGRTPSNAKPIYQIDKDTNKIIAEFKSAGEAAISLGINNSANIRRTANGTGKTAYGYKWRWKE